MNKIREMDAKTLSDEELENLFTEAYETQVGKLNDISEFEASCKRETGSSDVTMEVMICGMCGTPSISEYKEMKIDNISSVIIEREDKGRLKFKLVAKETVYLNTNDYVVIYKSV